MRTSILAAALYGRIIDLPVVAEPGRCPSSNLPDYRLFALRIRELLPELQLRLHVSNPYKPNLIAATGADV